ncbi:uncharacterized protein CDV56_109182 [Aspergillus thermomutatus]|uniref:Cytochrome P450 n=1 Tax=Aspergillus thermomutatus TaxID=41047 RepID=A0A397HQP9_ASPTH|nr:uncharacterized protein CDV56_109182 [Aspergillus thermomutatus]RHZ65529.1 hypothetical protein CDV56_109182 [Aspergillus thermomutatus]
MHSTTTLLITSLVALFLYKTIRLFYYLRLARATTLPYAITPFLETEAVSLLMNPVLRYIYRSHLDRSEGWPRWCRFFIKDWSWEDKRRAHDEYGDVFLCVSPEGIICYSADATLGWDVMNRRNDFTKPRDKYKILEPYGPNVATAEGKTYQFYVRITAPPFSDLSGVNSLVWKETMYQTNLLTEAWSQSPPQEIQLDVNPNAGALNDTVRYMVPILLIPRWLLNITLWKKAAVAHAQLDRYLRQIIRDQRAKLSADINHDDADSRGNLLTAVVRASMILDREKASAESPRQSEERTKGFTDDETMGNLFIYLLAGGSDRHIPCGGFSNSDPAQVTRPQLTPLFTGSLCWLSTWKSRTKVIDEIDQVYQRAQAANRSELTYEDDFELLEYTYGFMYETFRLFPGVTLITKVASKPEHIITDGPNGSRKSYVLPAETRVYLSAPGVHYHPKYWPEPYKLDPGRWLSARGASNTTATNGKRVVASDRTRQMRGKLLTFLDGSRACLGRKFAQAEYIAFFVSLLRRYRVELAPGSDPAVVERDLYGKSGGKITLTPLDSVQLLIRSR